jgi:microcystin-dependent protein
MTQPFLAEIRMFGGNFAIRGWAMCNGQLMSIAQNSALFSLIGTTYGGDGIQTFALPNLQSRVSVGEGNGPGLTPRVIGEASGQENVTLLTTQIPQHMHGLLASQTTAAAGGEVPNANVILGTPSPANGHLYTVNDGSQPPPIAEALVPASCGASGGNQQHPNLMPTLCVTFLIALEGIFPSRN